MYHRSYNPENAECLILRVVLLWDHLYGHVYALCMAKIFLQYSRLTNENSRNGSRALPSYNFAIHPCRVMLIFLYTRILCSNHTPRPQTTQRAAELSVLRILFQWDVHNNTSLPRYLFICCCNDRDLLVFDSVLKFVHDVSFSKTSIPCEAATAYFST